MLRSVLLPLLLPVCLFSQVEKTVADAAEAALARFGPELTAQKLAITVIDRQTMAHASYNGEAPIYPASVVKLFYLVALEERLESGQVKDSPELERAVHDMIVDSTNEATALVLDTITGTTSGPELEPAAMKDWLERRNAVNRYFTGLGYTGINVNQKTFSEGPYGRERQARGPNFENNNRLTTDAVARLMMSIVTRQAVTQARSQAMMALLARNYTAPKKGTEEDQAHDFSAAALPPGTKYYSKAGWTSTTRHDATYVELPNGARYVAVIFTVDNANRKEIIPFIAKKLAGAVTPP